MGDILLVGSCAGCFLALDRHDGTEIWSYDTCQDGTAAQFHGDPVVVNNMVVTGSDRSSRSHTYAFDIESGRLVWKHGGSALETDLILVGDRIIGRRWNGDLLGLDVANGDRDWILQPTDYLYRFKHDCSPAAQGSVVVVGGVDGVLYAVEGGSGEVIWTYDSGDAFTTAIEIYGNDVYVGLSSQDFLRVSLDGGELQSSIHLSECPIGQPAASTDEVFVIVGRGNLVALTRDLSGQVWEQAGEPRWTTPRPLLWRDIVVVGKQNGIVRGYHRSSGEAALELTLEGRVRGLGSFGDMIYVGTMNGNLFACRPRVK